MAATTVLRFPRIRRMLAVALLCGLGIVAYFALRPVGLPLETYTSRPIGSTGYRLQMKIPAGWKQGAVPSGYNEVIMIEPKRPPSWLPNWIQQLLGYSREDLLSYYQDEAFVVVSTAPSPFLTPKRLVINELRLPNRSLVHCADITVPIEGTPHFVTISYRRMDKSIFDKTYKAICESPRLIK